MGHRHQRDHDGEGGIAQYSGGWSDGDQVSVPPRDERHTGQLGDLDAPDIVGPTGEEMPRTAHDQVGTTTPLEDDRHRGDTDRAGLARALGRRRRTRGTS